MGIPLMSANLAPLERRFAVAGLERLSAVERDILNRWLLGESAEQIGNHRGISSRTVESHKTNIQNKLGLSTKRDIHRVMWALVIDGVGFATAKPPVADHLVNHHAL